MSGAPIAFLSGSIETPPTFTPTLMKNLEDKNYEKRKAAATEIEHMAKGWALEGNQTAILRVIHFIRAKYCESDNFNSKKGGLIGLAGISIGLGYEHIENYIKPLIDPILQCMQDIDSKVRYYSCEAMYNVSKVAKNKILIHFNDIFDSLCRACADNDSNVKTGAQLLDRLIKETVTDSKGFNVELFIPVLRQHMNATNPSIRQFLVGWISVLDSVDGINMIDYLPDFLDGLFLMLSDPSKELRRQADAALIEFLKEIKQSPTVDYARLFPIILNYCESRDEFTKFTAINWSYEFIELGREKILDFATDLLSIYLMNHSHESDDIQQISTKANVALMGIIVTDPTYDLDPLFDVLIEAINDPNKWTKLSVLNCMMTLFVRFSDKMEPHLDQIFPALIKLLGDPEENVVTVDLDLISQISLIEKYFSQLVDRVLRLFESETDLLQKNGNLVIRSLCSKLGPERMYRAFSQFIQKEENPDFALSVVRILNTILLTDRHMEGLRNLLKDISATDGRDLFLSLYKPWCHNPASLYCLCLLAGAYEHSSALITKYAEMEITQTFLLEVDQIVQLIESPIFMDLRLKLLEPTKYPYLYKSLYGILMLLPHNLADSNFSSTFSEIRHRLTSVATMELVRMDPDVRLKNCKPVKQTVLIDWTKLVPIFEDVQMRRKQAYRQKASNTSNWTRAWADGSVITPMCSALAK